MHRERTERVGNGGDFSFLLADLEGSLLFLSASREGGARGEWLGLQGGSVGVD
jgi:hypothetical protein